MAQWLFLLRFSAKNRRWPGRSMPSPFSVAEGNRSRMNVIRVWFTVETIFTVSDVRLAFVSKTETHLMKKNMVDAFLATPRATS